jgi:hypothetical protein
MFENAEKKYYIWTKHYDDLLKLDLPVIEKKTNLVYSIIVHPAHPPVLINVKEDILEQVRKLEKSTQLYFFGLIWMSFLHVDEHKELLIGILNQFCSAKRPSYKRMRRDMLWDDHAVSERASVLSTFLSLNVANEIAEEKLLEKIYSHIEDCKKAIESFVESNEWDKNNHRIFHLCAALALSDFFKNEAGVVSYANLLKDTLSSLFHIDSGISVEQSVSYYSFDLILLKKVFDYVDGIGLCIADINYKDVFLANKSSMSFLAFPDGQLPASGDTPLGFSIKKPFYDESAIPSIKKNLADLGHFKITSKNKMMSVHMIAHNAESAHGHNSPLHFDFWVKGIGQVLVDSGGPYLYGNKLRYDWFRHIKAHNCLFPASGDYKSALAFAAYLNDDEIEGGVLNKSYMHLRRLCIFDSYLKIEEKVRCKGEWKLNYHFAPGNLTFSDKGCVVYEAERGRVELFFDSTLDASLEEGYRTYGRGKKVLAPYLSIAGSGNCDASVTIRA